MDGENTTLYRDAIHARSLDWKSDATRSWVSNKHAQVQGDIPAGWRVCCENLYVKHSIGYDDLEDYVYVFSVWDGDNFCLAWEETLEWCKLLGLVAVPVLYVGPWDEKACRAAGDTALADGHEGYVVRLRGRFHYDAFRSSVAKCVREDHVATPHHWRHSKMEKNQLKDPR